MPDEVLTKEGYMYGQWRKAINPLYPESRG